MQTKNYARARRQLIRNRCERLVQKINNEHKNVPELILYAELVDYTNERMFREYISILRNLCERTHNPEREIFKQMSLMN